jgi:hypothetical protein
MLGQLKRLLALAIPLLIQSGLVRADTFPYEYVWTGGQPGFSGVLYLDSPSSNGGSISDIGLGSYLRTPNSWGDMSLWGYTHSYQGFTWNPQQITSMYIGFNSQNVQGYVYENFGGQNGILWYNISTLPPVEDLDTSGSWLAVPEPSSASLLVFSMAAFCGWGLARRGNLSLAGLLRRT